MKLKVGDIVRVKTYEELEEGNGGDWDWPYTYSQGVSGIVKKIEKKDNRFRYFLKFNIGEMFTINPYDDSEDVYSVKDRMEDIVNENEKVPYSIEEIIVLKNKNKVIPLE